MERKRGKRKGGESGREKRKGREKKGKGEKKKEREKGKEKKLRRKKPIAHAARGLNSQPSCLQSTTIPSSYRPLPQG